MSERSKFIRRLLDGEKMTEVCLEFGISRKTGHKIWNRFEAHGFAGLGDASRRPLRSPQRTPRDIVGEIIYLRRRYPTWGPKKLRERFMVLNPGVHAPAASTIGVIIDDAGLVDVRRRRRRFVASPTSLRRTTAPNQLWCIDFKGHFRLGDRRYCYPLTLSDHFSRFLLLCEALENTRGLGARAALEGGFREYGLPDAVRSDTGAPFASTGRLGLTPLSVWLLRLGIELERIEPGHPEQNGRHERMHLTLKQETTRPAAANLLQQQERFDDFSDRYNNERPHEALHMQTPASVHTRSTRSYEPQSALLPIAYPLHDETAKVFSDGSAYVRALERRVYVGTALAGENIGLRELASGTWLVSFLTYALGYLDDGGRLLPFSPTDEDKETTREKPETTNRVLPMSPV
jgi:putative transposase